MDWNKVKHVSEGGGGTSPSSINWNNVRHISQPIELPNDGHNRFTPEEVQQLNTMRTMPKTSLGVESPKDIQMKQQAQRMALPKNNSTPIDIRNKNQNFFSDPKALQKPLTKATLFGLDIAGRPANAVVNALVNENQNTEYTKMNGKLYPVKKDKLKTDIGTAFMRGLKGQDRPDALEMAAPKSVIDKARMDHPVLTGVSDLALSSITDPTTYIGGAAVKTATKKLLGKIPLETTQKIANGAIKVEDAAKAAGKTEEEVRRLLDNEAADLLLKDSKEIPKFKQYADGSIVPQSTFEAVRNPVTYADGSIGEKVSIEKKPVLDFESQPQKEFTQEQIARPGAQSNNGLSNKVGSNASGSSSFPTGNIPSGQKERSFGKTVVNSDTSLPGLKDPLKENLPKYDPITNVDTLAKAQSIIDSNLDEATRVVKSNAPATAESNAMAQLLMQKAQQEGRFQDAIDIVEITSKKATDAGQAIQALSMWGRLTPEGMLKYAQKTIDKVGSKAKLTADDAKFITQKMEAIGSMAEGRAKDVEIASVLDFVASKTPSSALQKISTLQTVAQLLNPKTAIRNLGGNTAFAGAENASNVLAAGVDKAASIFTGKRTTVLPSLATQVKGFGKGFKLGLEDAIKGIDTSSIKTQFDLPKTTFRKGPLATLEKAMNVELKATDRGFYQAAYDESLRQQMKAANITTPTQEMLDNAHLDGLYKTFQDDNIATKAFTKFKSAFNGGKEWGLGDILLKYPKTPANLLMRGIDYSPAGVIKSLFDLRKGQRAFVNSLSRGMIGTSILGAGIALYDLGILTGKRNKDKDVDSLQRTTGVGGYKLNLSALNRFLSSGFDREAAKIQQGDNIINYDWLQPLSIPFAAGANIGENNKTAKPEDILSAVVASLEGGASTLAEQPLVQGVSKAFQGYDPVQALIESLAGAPASFVPAVLNQTRQFTDNTARNVDSDNIFKKSLNMVQNKIPGFNAFGLKIPGSKDLPERVNTLGQTQQVYQNNNLGNVFFNPAFSSKYDAKPGAQLPLDVFERTGSKEQFPRIAAKSVTVRGQNIDFTPEEQAQFQRYMGEFTSQMFAKVQHMENFQKLTDDGKIMVMKKILDKSTEQAKIKILRDKGLVK